MKFSLSCVVLVMLSFGGLGQQPEGDRIRIDSRRLAGLPGTQQQINQKIRDWFGTNFSNPNEIITDSSPGNIAASYYDDCTVYDKRVYFNHDMRITLDQRDVEVDLWVVNERETGKSAREYFFKKNGDLRPKGNKPLTQLVERGRFFVSEMEAYLKNQ